MSSKFTRFSCAMFLFVLMAPSESLLANANPHPQYYDYVINHNAATIKRFKSLAYTELNITNFLGGVKVSEIGEGAFSSSPNVACVVIPEGVTTIGKAAFRRCPNLTQIIMPQSLTKIDDFAFAGCKSLKSVTIPARVESIGEGAFAGCANLSEIIVDPANYSYCADDGVLYSRDKSTLVQCTAAKRGSFFIPSQVVNIGNRAFSACTNISEVIIPLGVTNLGNRAFYRCEGLAKINIPESVSTLGAEGSFELCKNLSEVSLPKYTQVIGSRTFAGCSSLREISLPQSVTNIGAFAFAGCDALTSITIPANVAKIGEGAFAGCDRLAEIVVEHGNEHFCAENGVLYTRDKSTLIQCSALIGCSFMVSPFVRSLNNYSAPHENLWVTVD